MTPAARFAAMSADDKLDLADRVAAHFEGGPPMTFQDAEIVLWLAERPEGAEL